jgi:hypothetical protein
VRLYSFSCSNGNFLLSLLLQFFDDLHCQCRLGLVAITGFQAGSGLEQLKEQRKGDLIQDTIGVDGHDIILELAQIALDFSISIIWLVV